MNIYIYIYIYIIHIHIAICIVCVLYMYNNVSITGFKAQPRSRCRERTVARPPSLRAPGAGLRGEV